MPSGRTQKRILNTRGVTFESFIKDHCPISKSRIYEIIAIADGRKTVEEVREKTNERKQRFRSGTEDQPEKPNVSNKTPKQPTPTSTQAASQDEREVLLREVLGLVRMLDVP